MLIYITKEVTFMDIKNRKYNYSINFCADVAKISSDFERENTDLKRQYFIKNINKVNEIMQSINGYKGSFGTGYPFYVLDKDLNGDLPLIEEQINYNNRLIASSLISELETWICADCLEENYDQMFNLKVLCKPCPKMDNDLKPRKVINRLPDIDMWMICDDDMINYAKYMLPKLFAKENMHTSDTDVMATINEIREINLDLKNNIMPKYYLPLDVHIIEYSKFKDILNKSIVYILNYLSTYEIPYLPIHPYSLRKEWQKDDKAYNFILDFIFSLTHFNWDSSLEEILNRNHKIIALMDYRDIEDLFLNIAPDSVKRRYSTKHLQKSLKKRVESWK